MSCTRHLPSGGGFTEGDGDFFPGIRLAPNGAMGALEQEIVGEQRGKCDVGVGHREAEHDREKKQKRVLHGEG